MKIPLLFVLFLGLFVSCAPEPNEPDREQNALIHSPESKVLTPAAASRKSVSSLVCGCRFVLRVSNAGDTSIIKYAIPALDSAANHEITVSANTAGLAAGTYTSWLALWSYDWQRGALFDTLYDTLIVP